MRNAMDEAALRTGVMARASEQFARYGYAKTTTGEIAAAAGISKKTLYRLFQSKEELFREVAFMHLHEVRDKFDALSGDRLLTLIDKLWESMRVLVEKIRDIGSILKEKPGIPEGVYDELLKMRRDIIVGFYRKLFREGVKKGFINRRVNETAFIIILMTVIQSLFTPEVLATLPLSNLELFTGVAYTLLEGVLSDRERKNLREKPPVVARDGKEFWHA
jgi:AcrR family transcriptional regulator